MLVLERRPVQTTAREVYLDYRREGYESVIWLLRSALGDLPLERREDDARTIAQFFQALFDGLFISHEIEQYDAAALTRRFDLAAVALRAVLEQVRTDALG